MSVNWNKNVGTLGKVLKKYLILFLASTLYAASVSFLFDPNNIAPGGFSGIAIIINYLTGLGVGAIYLFLNVPVMILGIWKFGIRFFVSTIFCIVTSSGMTDFFSQHFEPFTYNPLLASIAGAAISAVSIGVIFRNGATSGGTDIIVRIVKQRYKHLRTGTIFQITDGMVVLASILVFKNVEAGLYGAISVYIMAVVLNKVLYGGDAAMLTYIISGKNQIIRKRLLEELDVGATVLEGEGAYRREPVDIIMCVTRNTTGPRIKQIVHEEDRHAFMIVSSANNVFGSGFTDYEKEEL